jgi:hypothetical protein
MQKSSRDYDNVFKTMKSKHKRLFIPVINEVFGKNIRFPDKNRGGGIPSGMSELR